MTVTVSADEVHKRNDDRVWLRTATVDAGGTLTATFDLAPSAPTIRLAELLEVQRQAGLVQVHRHLGVPLDEAFILNLIELDIASRGRSLGSRVAGELEARFDRVVRTRGGITLVTQLFTLSTKSGLTAHGYASTTLVPQRIYGRLRRAESPWPPTRASSPHHSGAMRTPFSIDLKDPILSDHESDHVSAMSVVCAIENSLTADGRPLQSLTLAFRSYGDKSTTSALEVWPRPQAHFTGSLVQDGLIRAVFHGRTASPDTGTSHG